jgi:BMFP domain-containing protein YqiC
MKIENLESSILALQSKMDSLESRISRLEAKNDISPPKKPRGGRKKQGRDQAHQDKDDDASVE